MAAAEADATRSLRELEAEQERLSARNYELEAELRRTQNLLSQTALDLDRAENRILFNQEQARQLEMRAAKVVVEIEHADRDAADLQNRMTAHNESVAELRTNTAALESALRDAMESAASDAAEQQALEARIDELRLTAARLGEESVRSHAEALQGQEAVARLSAAETQRATALATIEADCVAHSERAHSTDERSQTALTRSQELGQAAREAQTRLADLRRAYQELKQSTETTRESLSAARARRASLANPRRARLFRRRRSKTLRRQRLRAKDFRAVGLLADYAEVEDQFESAIEGFLRDELEYVVVETFESARAGVALLRDEMGGRATFFVIRSATSTSLRAKLPMPCTTAPAFSRVDRLVKFREPLGPAINQFSPSYKRPTSSKKSHRRKPRQRLSGISFPHR